MRVSAKILGCTLALLFVSAALIWYAVLHDQKGELTVTFLPVGQGDSVLIDAPSGRRVLIDGGPDGEALRQLGQALPFYVRSVDLVIAMAQSPQKIGGLASVLSRYSTTAIARSAALSSSPQAQAFTGAVSAAQQNGARLLILQRGQVIDLGGASIEVFFPDRDASSMPSSDGCLVLKFLFGKASFLFSCGTPAIETYLATLDGEKLRSDVLLATGEEPELFLGMVMPQFAVVPCGTTSTSSFDILQIRTLKACAGTVSFVSDGRSVSRN